VNATDLNSWANTRVSQQEMPRLIRMLVSATTESIERIAFPSGDSVQSGGFDGMLITANGNAFVPQGVSIWEFGTDRNPKGKADSDFQKRTENPLGIDKSNTTFVFVTPRRWGNKERWETERKQEEQWADVRAYDADDIEQWLETAPAVNIWFGHLIGKRPEHSQDIATFWNEWRSETRPELSERLLMSTREAAVERLQKWLDGGQALTVQSDTVEEAIAFFASYIETLPLSVKNNLHSRIVIANNPDVFRTLLSTNDQLIIIPKFTGAISSGMALQRGHKVYLPIDKSVSSSIEAVVLPSYNTRTLEAALVDTNIPLEQAREMALMSRGSLSILRRLTAVIPEAYTPLWARSEWARDLIPFLLVGEWDHGNEEDRKVIVTITGRTYDDAIAIFTRWANEPDAPVRKVGNIYQLKSRRDAWQNLNQYIDLDDIRKLSEAVNVVLNILDPRYELPKEDRHFAAIYKKLLPHSRNLRNGLSESLAMLSNHSNSHVKDRVRRIVWDLFRNGAHWVYWASFDGALSFLAEAEPDAVLTGLDRSLSDPSFEIGDIFKQEISWGGCAQSDLLWALEVCAWNPSYLGRVAILLARLDKVDEGGNYSNRPFNSLVDIFLCWHPQTMANVSKRFEVIDSLLRYEETVGWRLLLELLPSQHSTTTGTQTPKWKDWAKDYKPGISNIELYESIEMVCQRIITYVSAETSRWVDVIDKLNEMLPEYCNNLINLIASIDIQQLNRETRMKLWEKLREEVHRNRKYSETDWALPAEATERLFAIYRSLEPDSFIDKYGWLFTWHPDHPDCIEEEWEKEQERVKQIQTTAIQEVMNQEGVATLIEFSKFVERPSILGNLAGKFELVRSNIITILTTTLGSDNNKVTEFSAGLVGSFFQEVGWQGTEEVITKTSRTWNSGQLAEFFRYLPFDKATWEHFSNYPEIRELYWKGLGSWLRPTEDDYLEAISNLLEFDRPCAAFFIISHVERAKMTPPTELVIEVLFQLIRDIPDSNDWKSIQGSFDYEFNRLIEYLDGSGVAHEVLERLEWMYLPLYKYRRKPKYLMHKVARESDFFSQVIEVAFNDETGEDLVDESEKEDKKRLSRLAYELLNECIIVPGATTDGCLHGETLKSWISNARQLCSKINRIKAADYEIGKLLAYSPNGMDGHWPHEDVREIIEELQSDELEAGLRTELYNKRGAVTRSIGEGGRQERILADRYKEDAVACEGRWFRTSTIMHRISERYEEEAKREDERAELD